MGPIAEWILNSGSITGTVVADAADGNPATVVGGPLTFPSMGASFDGATQYIDSPLVPSGSALTVAAWIVPASLSGGQGGGFGQNPRIVANSHTDVDHNGFQLMFNSGGASGFFDVGNGAAEGVASWSQQLAVNVPYYYVGTYDGINVKAYINATLVASTPFAGGLIAAGSGPHINVGRNPAYAGDYFNGAVYDVRIYNRALSASEITTLYNANTTLVSVTFSTNPVSVLDNIPASTSIANAITTFTVWIANGTTYAGTPTGVCVTQSPCPFSIGGSIGAWYIANAALNSSYDTTNKQFTVTAP
jgi:hypothetical protein